MAEMPSWLTVFLTTDPQPQISLSHGIFTTGRTSKIIESNPFMVQMKEGMLSQRGGGTRHSGDEV